MNCGCILGVAFCAEVIAIVEMQSANQDSR